MAFNKRGEDVKTHRLTEEQVRQMKTDRANGVSLRKLAARFGISLVQAGRIARGECWAHVRV